LQLVKEQFINQLSTFIRPFRGPENGDYLIPFLLAKIGPDSIKEDGLLQDGHLLFRAVNYIQMRQEADMEIS
jgi:hypothetical protein